MLYAAQLAIILWWLLDHSPRQVATAGLLEQVRHLMPMAALALKIPGMHCRVRAFDDALIASGLLGR